MYAKKAIKIYDMKWCLGIKQAFFTAAIQMAVWYDTGNMIKYIDIIPVSYENKNRKGGEQDMNGILKNIQKKEILLLKEQIEYQPGQIVSKTLVQNQAVSLTLFAFDKEEEISTHSSEGDAMVTVLEGSAKITIDGAVFLLREGETIVMPAHAAHAVYAQQQFKMLLTVVFSC